MHKFYWNNKQSARGGLSAASHGNAETTESVFDKPRHNAHQPMSEASKKGSAKMSHSKSEYNFNSIKNISGANISVHNQSNAAQCKITNSSQDYCDSINPELPKRSDGGIKTVVRVTSSPLKTEESSTKQQLTSSKSHSDMRGHLQCNNQHGVSNKHDESHANTAQSSNNKANKTPVGSHRVLLKLRRLSGKESRPKSVHGVESLDGGKSGKNNSNDHKEPNDQSDSVSLKGMSTSKSMHQFYFYNRTWNERSLQKYSSNNSNSHNYENVYSGFQESEDGNSRTKAPPVYENITVASEYQQNAIASNNPLIINTLTCSPKSSIRNGSRISIIPSDYNNDQSTNSRIVQNSSHNWDQTSSFNKQEAHTPIPPERKGRRASRNGNILDNSSRYNNGDNNFMTSNQASSVLINNDNNHRQLYRSKSCERPKMKDSVRDTFKLLSNETSDRLQNNFNRFSSNFTDKFLTSNSIMNKFACGSGSGNGSTRSSNSSYNGKSGSNSSKMSTGSSDYCSSKNSSNMSYNSNNETALQATNLQNVGIKNFIPCVDIQVRNFSLVIEKLSKLTMNHSLE